MYYCWRFIHSWVTYIINHYWLFLLIWSCMPLISINSHFLLSSCFIVVKVFEWKICPFDLLGFSFPRTLKLILMFNFIHFRSKKWYLSWLFKKIKWTLWLTLLIKLLSLLIFKRTKIQKRHWYRLMVISSVLLLYSFFLFLFFLIKRKAQCHKYEIFKKKLKKSFIL